MPTRKQSLETIRKAYDAIGHIQHSWGFMAEKLFDLNAASERQHRRHRPASPISVATAAKLFTVKHLAESLQSRHRYTVDDILSIRSECLYAQAFAKKYRKEIRAAWKAAGVPVADILALDYAELMGAFQ